MPQPSLICRNDRARARRKIPATILREASMTFGEQAYVGMVIGAMAIFGLALAWASLVAKGK